MILLIAETSISAIAQHLRLAYTEHDCKTLLQLVIAWYLQLAYSWSMTEQKNLPENWQVQQQHSNSLIKF